jgi:transposase
MQKASPAATRPICPTPNGWRWADGACAGTFARRLEAERGWRIEVSQYRDPHHWRYGVEEKPKGFQVIPRRWVVERIFALDGIQPSCHLRRDPAHLTRGTSRRASTGRFCSPKTLHALQSAALKSARTSIR